MDGDYATPPPVSGRAKAASMLLGVGVGGLLDAVVFHQILQWHHVICFSCNAGATARDQARTVLVDGAYEAAALGLAAAGVLLLVRALRSSHEAVSARMVTGAALMGVGIFNVAEGVLEHHLLGMHHLRPGAYEAAWDAGWLVAGGALVVIGRALARPERELTLARIRRRSSSSARSSGR